MLSAFAKASADWHLKPVEAFGVDGCCGPCMTVIPSVFGTGSGAAPARPHCMFGTLMAARYGIITAADNWVTVVTSGGAALPGS